jgi:hypothetical protein
LDELAIRRRLWSAVSPVTMSVAVTAGRHDIRLRVLAAILLGGEVFGRALVVLGLPDGDAVALSE